MNLPRQIISNVEKALLGKPDTVRYAVACFLSGGHLLIDDIPGVGKTTLALALSKSIGCTFQRIQFTSDLLPSDMLGVSIYNQKNQVFEFKSGPIFHNIVLADEINRASPKTQSALLEAMQEHQVSIDNETRDLPYPFFVIATQNPHEHHGTFHLPESQLDRFLMRLELGYPTADIETQILAQDSLLHRVSEIQSVASLDEVKKLIEKVRVTAVDESLNRYIVELAQLTRKSPLVELGLSPRGTLALRRAAQAMAVIDDRSYVIPDDIKSAAVPVISHRLRIRGGNYNGHTPTAAQDIVRDLMSQVAVPT
jgi:MoxR-like ATPase